MSTKTTKIVAYTAEVRYNETGDGMRVRVIGHATRKAASEYLQSKECRLGSLYARSYHPGNGPTKSRTFRGESDCERARLYAEGWTGRLADVA